LFRSVASRTTPKPNPRFHGRNAVASLCTSAKRCRIARLNQALWLAARFFEARPHWCLPLPASLSTFMHESGCVQTWPCPLSGINVVTCCASCSSAVSHILSCWGLTSNIVSAVRFFFRKKYQVILSDQFFSSPRHKIVCTHEAPIGVGGSCDLPCQIQRWGLPPTLGIQPRVG